MYHKYSHRDSGEIPKLLGGLLVVLVMIAGVLFSRQGSSLSVAPEATIVTQYEVGNVSASAVTIFWRTNTKTDSYIAWGQKPSQLDSKMFDAGSTAGDPTHNHSVTIKNLMPDTTYFYQIKDGRHVLGNKRSVYQVVTAKKSGAISSLQPIYGTVKTESDSPVKNAVVILKSAKIIPQIASVKADGTFLFSLCCTLNGKRKLVELTSKDELDMTLIDEDGNALVVQDTVKNMLAQSTSFVVGSQYSRVDAGGAKIEEPVEQTFARPTIAPSVPEVTLGVVPDDVVLGVTDAPKSFDILYPFEGASISSGRPLIKGLAPAASIIELQFLKKVTGGKKNPPQFMRARTDENGKWNGSPVTALLPGDYTITALVEGTQRTEAITREFYIQKSGEAVLGDATGSATLTPTTSLTATPFPTSALTTTIAPTTMTPIVEPPVTGFSIVPIAGVSILCMIIGLGFLLIF